MEPSQTKVKLLIADDSPISRHLLEVTLRKWGYDVHAVADGQAAWDELQRADGPRLAILDWMMPGHTGPEVCRMVRSDERERYVYLILLTSKSLKQDLIEGMEAGADDYLTKPFDQHELQVRLRAGIRILELQSELLEAREKLMEQATRDSLTGLWNRATILDMLANELDRMSREDFSIGLIMADLDHFKQINDTYGHLAGDEVLREFGRRVRSVIRSYDSVGRYGGEEFLILLPGCGDVCVSNNAERLRKVLCDKPFLIGDREISVSASFGCSFAAAQAHAAPEHLIRVADEALYQAKRDGRNRVCYTPFEMMASRR